MNARLCMAIAAAALALAACGGGGSDRNDDDTVPDSALESPEAFSSWVGGRRATDDKEPLVMLDVMPPTSETAEPTDID
jgi:ABC-type glycerol-3-phosphate transport system substrate-binding protein